MAELASTAREYDKAINFYKEGLTYDETYVPVWSYGSVTEFNRNIFSVRLIRILAPVF